MPHCLSSTPLLAVVRELVNSRGLSPLEFISHLCSRLSQSLSELVCACVYFYPLLCLSVCMCISVYFCVALADAAFSAPVRACLLHAATCAGVAAERLCVCFAERVLDALALLQRSRRSAQQQHTQRFLCRIFPPKAKKNVLCLKGKENSALCYEVYIWSS